MGFIQAITDFFESIFNKSSPEVQKRLQLKKLDTDIRVFQPVLYKNGNLLPNFAEAIRILYVNTKPLDDLFTATIGGSDIPRHQRFESQLVLTGFTMEDQERVESLLYENRKKDVLESAQPVAHELEIQRRTLDKVIKSLNDDGFKKMDKDLIAVHQLSDLCRYSFVTILQIFAPGFSSLDITYEPKYQEVPLGRIGNTLEDLYFQTTGLQLNTAVANAVLALAQLKNGGAMTQERTNDYLENIKKIAYILTRILTPDRLKMLICLYKEDTSYVPKTAAYSESARQNFATRFEQQYKADELRIKTELKDQKITSELSKLFNGAPLAAVTGYDSETDAKLQSNS